VADVLHQGGVGCVDGDAQFAESDVDSLPDVFVGFIHRISIFAYLDALRGNVQADGAERSGWFELRQGSATREGLWTKESENVRGGRREEFADADRSVQVDVERRARLDVVFAIEICGGVVVGDSKEVFSEQLRRMLEVERRESDLGKGEVCDVPGVGVADVQGDFG